MHWRIKRIVTKFIASKGNIRQKAGSWIIIKVEHGRLISNKSRYQINLGICSKPDAKKTLSTEHFAIFFHHH